MKIINVNKKALHNYHIIEKLEAGIVLTGDEVKSIRQGHVSLNEAFATISKGEITLLNCHITPYSHAYTKVDQSRKTRKLLLHKKEITKLIGAVSTKGMTLVPLKIYLNEKGLVKIEIGLAKHKDLISKKKELREKDINREAQREIRAKF